MTKQIEVQRKIIDTIVKNDFRGIVLSSVRSGKTRILLTSIKEHNTLAAPKVLVLYPNIDVKNAWTDECEKIGCPFEITYSTFVSIEKVMDGDWDYIVFDEAHLIPDEHKLPIAGAMAKKYKHIIFASGTYTNSTLADLTIHTSLPLIVNYTTERAIADGLISNYTIYVHEYKLCDVTLREFKSGNRRWKNTDVKELERLSNRVSNASGLYKKLAAISRMRFINSNDSLREAIIKWIRENPNERFIVFVENGAFGKKLNLPMFNSKSKDDSVLVNFQEEKINRLCLIKKGSAGVTYPKLDNILITAINSNGETLEQMIGRSLLKDTEHSNIHIFTTNNKFQLNWLENALSNISESRVIWVKKKVKL